MCMKKIALFAVMVCLGVTVFSQKNNPKKSTPVIPAKNVLKTSMDTFCYAVGANIASNLAAQGVSEMNYNLLKKGMEDVFNKKMRLLDENTLNMSVQQKLQEYAMKKVQAEKDKGAAFLAQNKKRKGVVELPNGLQYEVLTAAKDAAAVKPTAEDTVVVHYVGTLTDGTEFDNSVKRGQPATFALNRVIKGWTEILQLMPAGSKWKVWIPSDLGYGDRGTGRGIPGGATLVFEIELMEVKPKAVQ